MSEKTPREQIALLKNVIEDLQERVQTASESIRAIAQALDEQHDEAAQPDFERLRYESEKQAYEGHPAARSAMPELYFLLLVSVLTAADATEAQWRHLYRTAAGAGYEADVRDLLPDAYSLTDAKLIEAVDSIERDALVNAFVLDCILLALLHEGDDSAILAYIAGLFALFGTEQAVIRETIQAAKIILAQDREAYLAAMAEMKHLAARESCCYLFHADVMTVTNDWVALETIASQHLMFVGLEETNFCMTLKRCQPGKITFCDCRFKDCVIHTSEKEVHFIDCTFCEDTGLDLQKSSSFKHCTFKNISIEYNLSLCNAEIAHCIFSDCFARSCALINLSTGTITDSEFIRCHWTKANGLSSDIDHLIFVRNASIRHCIFSYCESKCDAFNFSIIYAEERSAIEHCQFEQCIANSRWYDEGYMIRIKTPSTQSNNTFTNCKNKRHIY